MLHMIFTTYSYTEIHLPKTFIFIRPTHLDGTVEEVRMEDFVKFVWLA